ncbi:PLP-dependent aminotransferase family protein [Vibrio ruber]|uniref:MocR-like pyridoxine biosynthesis transcription factor PdxR n=1 Tax=Vibrio ruber TaxID=184755 RepID=UPI002892D6C6|nr:PLP-dependent aminotransferase family protein [Vibrio ruber]WNJ95954.1 PLP-dependent aminotransferase family protein [Vibrio ruber]
MFYSTTKMIDITGVLERDAKTSTGEKISLHKQLVARLQRAILSGRLPSGVALSSSRELASELGVSRNTVVLAYEHLAAEGYVIADQQGTRVAELNLQNEVLNSDIETKGKPLTLASRWKTFSDVSFPSLPKAALLAPGLPSLTDFPLASWQRSLERAVKQLHRHSLASKDPLGEPSLRKAIAAHLHISRGAQCDAEQVVITEGAQQALELCVTLMTNPDDTVWIEDPCYNGVKSALETGSLKIIPIPVDKEGISVTNDLWLINVPKLIFTSPAHQYPTGAVLSVSRRLELLDQARKAGSWIIEDDYDGDFRHFGSPIACMQGLTNNSPVIYIGSFSKTMYPTLRVGFMVIPKQIMNQADPVLSKLLRSNNQLQQTALADFITSGEFGRHLGRMRRIYRERQKVLKTALVQHFKEDWILGGSAGMHLTLKLPASIDDKYVARKAKELGIDVYALSTFYSEAKSNHSGLVIGYGNTHKDKIPEAIDILSKLIKFNEYEF